jgi:hypothetical protein
VNFGETLRVQDPRFFWAAHRLAVLHAREKFDFITLFRDPDALSLRTCRPDILLFVEFRGHAEHGFRVRAARSRGKAKDKSSGFLQLQWPLHPEPVPELFCAMPSGIV